MIKTVLSLDPDYGLEKQFLFWLAVLLPIAIAIALGLPVWMEYDLAFDAESYETFIIISRLPIGVASLSIPLGVLVSRLHSAKQTARQIENTRVQICNTEQDNRTKLYLSHFEHFCKHLDFVERSVCSRHKHLFKENQFPALDKLGMYKLLYPQNSLIAGIFAKGDHLSKFACNSMTRLTRDYRVFLYVKHYDEFVGALNSLERGLLDIQLRCFCFVESTISIFQKVDVKRRTKNDFPFGVSPMLSHYFSQVEFFLELLLGVESFDAPEDQLRIGERLLVQLRDSYNQKPEDYKELKNYLSDFIEKEKT